LVPGLQGSPLRWYAARPQQDDRVLYSLAPSVSGGGGAIGGLDLWTSAVKAVDAKKGGSADPEAEPNGGRNNVVDERSARRSHALAKISASSSRVKITAAALSGEHNSSSV